MVFTGADEKNWEKNSHPAWQTIAICTVQNGRDEIFYYLVRCRAEAPGEMKPILSLG